MKTGISGQAYRPGDAAEYLGITKKTLANWRCLGCGPEFSRVGTRHIVYRLEALDKFLKLRRATSTSDRPPSPAVRVNGAKAVAPAAAARQKGNRRRSS
jgi:hypothetical protein